MHLKILPLPVQKKYISKELLHQIIFFWSGIIRKQELNILSRQYFIFIFNQGFANFAIEFLKVIGNDFFPNCLHRKAIDCEPLKASNTT